LYQEKNQFKSFSTRIEVIAEGAATAQDYCEINYFITLLLQNYFKWYGRTFLITLKLNKIK